MKVTRQAFIVAAMGASGSGKSHFVKGLIAAKKPARLLIVDPDNEYGQLASLVTMQQAAELADLPRATFRARIVPSFDRTIGRAQFALACRIAWDAAVRGPLMFVVDELADFTDASHAPPDWDRLVRRGRKHGVSIIAASQRPADIDKQLWSNASFIRAGRCNSQGDQQALARALAVPVGQVLALSGYAWIARDRNTGKLLSG